MKKHEAFIDKSPVKIYINKIQNRITLKVKTWYYLEHSTLEILKLLRNTERRITKEMVKIIEVYLFAITLLIININIIKYQHYLLRNNSFIVFRHFSVVYLSKLCAPGDRRQN